jgi:CheY-like chemotaxis protein
MWKNRILLIDDEEDICRMIKLNLESTGEFEVTTARSGQTGLDMVKEEKFDLVITDFNMPGMKGDEVVHRLRAISPNMPLILFTIYHDDASTVTRSLRKKVDGVISKPFEHKDLYKLVKELLDKRKG